MSDRIEQRLAQLENEILELRKENQQLRQQVQELQVKLLQYENPNTPSSKKRFKEKKDDEGEKPRGRPPGAEGSTRPTPEPTETIEVKEDKCPHCHSLLGLPAFIESKVIEELPAPVALRIIRFLIAHYDCRCGRHVTAKHPELPAKGRFGPHLLAEIAHLRMEDRLPFRKIQKSLLRRHGVLITPATMLHVTERVADSLTPEYERLIKIIRAAAAVYCDETTFRVDGKDWYLWVFSDGTHTLFVLRDSRSGTMVDEILGPDFKGVIVSDGYAAYGNRGPHQRCWAHLIRELKFAVESEPKLSGFLEDLRGILHQVKKKLIVNPPPVERRSIRRMAEEELRQLLDCAKSHLPLRKFCTYLTNGMNDWLTFVEHPGVEPTNNTAELALREHVVMRRIIGTLRGEQGARTHSVLSSVLTTWRLEGRDTSERLARAVVG